MIPQVLREMSGYVVKLLRLCVSAGGASKKKAAHQIVGAGLALCFNLT